ncbi:LPS export ABC transporter permease LptF [Aquicoccus sp. SCR17]|nr:LPS export ABC transporter permease LptF [Carideicomes alvinocaridis]
MLSQLMVLFGFFALVLVSVYWVNRAVVLFDQLIADGHSALIFLEFSALSLPKVIGIVLPMAAFAGTVYVTNRLSSESELTVMQATGFSPWRLARPVFVFGLIVALMMGILTHFLIPASLKQLQVREAEISGSVTARLLREGTFLHPTRGVTFYIRDITTEGELQDVFLSDRRRPDRPVTYTADRAYLVRDEGATRLVMVEGMAQTLSSDGRLSTTNFDDFSYDVSSLIAEAAAPKPEIETASTWTLLSDPEAAAVLTDAPVAQVLEEAHGRFQQPLLGLGAGLIGFATLLVGGFSRFGVWRQIVGAIFLLVLVKLVESAVTEPVRSDPALWPLIYLPTVVALAITWGLLWRADHPFGLRRRRPARVPEAGT